LAHIVAGVEIPNSTAATAAIDFARRAMPRFLFNHSMRVFLWAALYAERERLPFDRELLLIAALLHDLGLVADFESRAKPFEEASADFAKSFVLRHGFSTSRADIVWQAIRLHAGNVPEGAPPDVASVELGAAVDVFGGTEQRGISQQDVEAVLEEFPRAGFKTEFRKLLAEHALRVPQHATWTQQFVCAPRCGPMAEAIANSPWDE
jgi:hypothetical protein